MPVSSEILGKLRVVDAIRGGATTTNLYGSNPLQGMMDAYNAIADSFYGVRRGQVRNVFHERML